MRKRRPIIVSPSGNLYGSEKVLLDFLATAEEDYEIYLPEGRLRRRIAGSCRRSGSGFSAVYSYCIRNCSSG